MTGPCIALVGAGYWGSRLARNLAEIPGCSLAWVCDVDSARAAAIGRAAQARPAHSLTEVLADPAVDAVVVATPASTHGAIVGACLRAGRHVLVEKPLAGSVAVALKCATIARASGRVLMVDHTYRFAPVTRTIAELIGSGALGAVTSVDSVRMNDNHGQPDVDVLWDLAHHDISIMAATMPEGAHPVAVRAVTTDAIGIGTPHAGQLTVHLRNGATVQVAVDWRAGRKVRTMTFRGTDATLTWDDLAAPMTRLRVQTRGQSIAGSVPVSDDGEPLAAVLSEFVAAIVEDRAPSCGPDDEIAVLAVLEAASRSAELDGKLNPVRPTGECDGPEVYP